VGRRSTQREEERKKEKKGAEKRSNCFGPGKYRASYEKLWNSRGGAGGKEGAEDANNRKHKPVKAGARSPMPEKKNKGGKRRNGKPKQGDVGLFINILLRWGITGRTGRKGK